MSRGVVLLKQLAESCDGDGWWSGGISVASLRIAMSLWGRSVFALALIIVAVSGSSVGTDPLPFCIWAAFWTPMPCSTIMLMCLSWVSWRRLEPRWFRRPMTCVWPAILGGVFHRSVPRWAEVCHGLMF